MPRILLVDEEVKTLNILNTLLRAEGYKVVPVVGLKECRSFIKSRHFDLAIIDVSRDPDSGSGLLTDLRGDRPELAVIALHDDKASGPGAGAPLLERVFRIRKPLQVKEFLKQVQRILDDRGDDASTSEDIAPLVCELEAGSSRLVAVSPAMREVCEIIERVAPTEIAVLVYGEKGLEKQEVAEIIHELSTCSEGQFLRFACGEVSNEDELNSILFGAAPGETGSDSQGTPGIFEKTGGGTLFLDGVDVLPVGVQAKINDVLRSRKIRRGGTGPETELKVRVIASSDENPGRSVQAGKLHADLHAFLSVMPIHIQPLRQRKEDIAPLVEKTLQSIAGSENRSLSCDDETMTLFRRYPWPGNTQELRETVRSVAERVSGNIITRSDLPAVLAVIGLAKGAR